MRNGRPGKEEEQPRHFERRESHTRGAKAPRLATAMALPKVGAENLEVRQRVATRLPAAL
ncbi:unnamed protein product [Acanthoscelides obtectus]|uniref:Uncharacterized protein n=1 Tax=Acanthoscelides obtectus TaxID=200917 RepID=A0A9P0QHU0_ACAOB|nr:unnamed protein product [Acanthoscelides obtectus]CAK1682908.1 hypothetical protein AOBTE_LOCUS33979 [Acanthoscelides obtectus]